MNSLDQIIEAFDQDDISVQPSSERQAITIWVSTSYQQRYEKLQRETNRKVSKLLKQVVTKVIDRLDPEPSV